MTGHNEVVRVVFDPPNVSLRAAAKTLLGKPQPDPRAQTRKRRRNTVPFRHLRLLGKDQQKAAKPAARCSRRSSRQAGHDAITTESSTAPTFYFRRALSPAVPREEPDGYCGLGGTGVCYAP